MTVMDEKINVLEKHHPQTSYISPELLFPRFCIRFDILDELAEFN